MIRNISPSAKPPIADPAEAGLVFVLANMPAASSTTTSTAMATAAPGQGGRGPAGGRGRRS